MNQVSTDVIIERIENFQEEFREWKKENSRQHKDLSDNQKTTNGKVRRLQIWKAGLAGAFAVGAFISSTAIRIGLDYIEEHKQLRDEYIKQSIKLERLDKDISDILDTYYIEQ